MKTCVICHRSNKKLKAFPTLLHAMGFMTGPRKYAHQSCLLKLQAVGRLYAQCTKAVA